MSIDVEKEKSLAATAAVALLQPQQIVGLGTGSTVIYALKAIGKLVRDGLQIQCVPTSNKTKVLAEELGIPLVDIDIITAIDITIDGADEFTPGLMLIKGGGGALLREKIVASMSKREIIIADSSKQVKTLGKFPLPLAVVPFAVPYVLRRLKLLHGTGKIRLNAGQPFITDDGLQIIDTDFGLIEDPVGLSNQLQAIEGVVAHGLFIHLTSRIIMGKEDSIVTFSS